MSLWLISPSVDACASRRFGLAAYALGRTQPPGRFGLVHGCLGAPVPLRPGSPRVRLGAYAERRRCLVDTWERNSQFAVRAHLCISLAAPPRALDIAWW